MVKKVHKPYFLKSGGELRGFWFFFFCVLFLDLCFLISSFIKGKAPAFLTGH